MNKTLALTCCCLCITFISLEAGVFFAVLAENSEGDSNSGCIEYNCTYVKKKNEGKDDCWISLYNDSKNGCFLESPNCPNATSICWLDTSMTYICPTPKCNSTPLKFHLWITSVFFLITFIVSCGITIYLFDKISKTLMMYQTIPN